MNAVIVVDDERPGFTQRGITRIVDATDDLRRLGVAPPQRILDAQRYAPALDAVIVKKSRLAREMTLLAELCLSLSPLVEPQGDVLFLDLTGIPRPVAAQLLEIEVVLEEAGHTVAMAASPGKRLSEALAKAAWRYGRGRPPRIFAPKERVPEVLDRLPLEVLGLTPELDEALRELGLVCARDLARLRSLGGLSARLHREARQVLDLLAEHDGAPVVGIDPPDVISEVLDLDWSLGTLEPLLFLLRPLAERLFVRLTARQEQLAAIQVELFLVPSSLPEDADRAVEAPTTRVVPLAFPEPLAEADALLRAISIRLDREGLAGEVHKARLVVTRTARASARQARLSIDDEPPDEAPHALAALLAELVAELGPDKVGCLEAVPEPLPERMTRLAWVGGEGKRRPRGLPDEAGREGMFYDLWPWPVRLLPAPVSADRLPVKERARFARLEGEDGHDRPFVRDYWVLTLTDGRRALGVVDPEEEELLVQGWFD